MTHILDKIKTYKLAEIAAQKREIPLSEMHDLASQAPPTRGFADALTVKAKTHPALIAEIKKASPSRGVIRADFDPAALAHAYHKGGAACLSVLTDSPSFQGDPAHLRAARAACPLPVLRKDFIFDAYQITQARAMGADCILLIMACLSGAQAAELEQAAAALGLDVLLEVHNAAELSSALDLRSRLVGINNRDLRDFTVDLAVTRGLAGMVGAGRDVVSESGIFTRADMDLLAGYGVSRFLIGESLMRCEDVETATRELVFSD